MLELGKGKGVEVRVAGSDATHVVPTMSHMPVPWVRRLRQVQGDEGGQGYFDFFLEYFAAYLGDDLDLLTMADVGELMAAVRDSEVGVGESSGSADS